MNTASLQLSKELYEVSGWEPGEQWYDRKDKIWRGHVQSNQCPAYTLDYLIRKLPKGTSVVKEQLTDGYNAGVPRVYRVVADTPEDACAMLAIELIKQKVIQV